MVVLSLTTPWVAAVLALILLATGLIVVGVAGVYARRFWRWRHRDSARPP
jgi:uncharacterized membrane protein YphA (DoxX/SURF4 family)